ncbi:MAG: hypothetical protein QM775_08490 [Pirellulales bacterium]
MVNTLIELGRNRPPVAASYETGEPVAIVEPTAVADAEKKETKPVVRTVSGPQGKSTTLAADAAQFTPDEGPGIYELRLPAGVRRIAVNLPAEEAKTAPLPVESLEALGVRLVRDDAAPTEATMAAQRTLQLEEMESRQQLWRPLLAAAVVLLVVETWFAGRAARRESTALGGVVPATGEAAL